MVNKADVKLPLGKPNFPSVPREEWFSSKCTTGNVAACANTTGEFIGNEK
jgi:hypothetical protein